MQSIWCVNTARIGELDAVYMGVNTARIGALDAVYMVC